MDLIDFREEYEASGEFGHLKMPHIKYVPGRGSIEPVVMLIGEAPGAQENLNGRPFVGRSGRLLDQLLSLAGLILETEYTVAPDIEAGEPEVSRYPNAYVTNTVKYRPPGNRTPTTVEIEKSLKWIRKEWKILKRPPVIVTIGAVPTKCLLGLDKSISDLAGEPCPIAAGGPTIWPMFHPAYALYNPPIRPTCEEHWTNLGSWLESEGYL
jgi:DNA polymerase